MRKCVIGIGVLSFTLGWIAAAPPLACQESREAAETDLFALLNTKIKVASKSSETISEAPGIVSVLTRDDLWRFGGVTLRDALNRVPGLIHVSSYLTDRSMMAACGDSIHKYKSNLHVLVLLDGRPVREVQEGGIKSDFYEAFPLAAVDHIEVIKGPGSVLYGSEAFSAVINIVTTQGRSNRTTLSTGVGQGGSFKHGAKIEANAGAFSLMGALQLIRRPDWLVPFATGDIPGGPTTLVTPFLQRTRSQGGFLRSRFKGLTIMGSYLRFDTPFMVPDYAGNIADSRLKKSFVDLGYDFAVSDRWNVTANLTYNRSWFSMLIPGSSPSINRDSHEVLGEVTSFHSLTSRVHLTVGVLSSRAAGTEWLSPGPQIVTSKGSRPSHALYSQASFRANEGVKCILGFQALKVGEAKFTVVPRLGLIWQPAPSLNGKIMYGEAFRAPYVNENFINYPGFLVGNRLLKPERVKSIQIGMTYTGAKGEVSLSGFSNRQSDLIAFEGLVGAMRYENQGKAVIKGIALEGKIHTTNKIFLVGSMLVQRTPKGEPTGYSDFGTKAGISYSGAVGTISLFNVHQGSIPAELNNPNSINPQAGPYNLLNMHAKVDLTSLLQLKSQTRLELTFEGENLLGKEIWLPSTGDAWPASIPVNKGRNLLAGARLVF